MKTVMQSSTTQITQTKVAHTKVAQSTRHTWLAFVLLIALSLGLFLYNQHSDELPDPDAFYHLQMAQLSAQSGVVRDFTWLPYTTLADHFVDQHLVFHWLMIPFVTFGDPFLGLRLFTALLGTAAIIAVAGVLRLLRLRWWWVVSLVLLITTPVMFRLNLVKAAPLSIIALCGIIWALVRRRPLWLGVISWAFVWLHGGFALAFPIVGIWMLADIMQAVTHNKPLPWAQSVWRTMRTWAWWQPLVMTSVGIGIGLVFNPYFPDNLFFYWEQLVQIGIVNYGSVIGVGGEWYPYEIQNLVIGCAVMSLLWLGALIGMVRRRTAWQTADWFALGISLFGLLITLKSRRYIEYYGPFMIIATAIWLQHYGQNIFQSVATASAGTAWQRLYKQLHVWVTKQTWQSTAIIGCVSLISIATVPVVLNDLQHNAQDIRSGQSVTKYATAMSWLNRQATSGDVILHSDWDDFPILLYYGPQFRYINGLDPTFMYHADAQRYQIWVDITTGTYTGNIDTALQDFNTAYIFVESDHQSMFNLVNSTSHTQLMYQDDEASIFSYTQ